MEFQGNFKEFLQKRSQPESESLTQKEMKELQEAIDKSKQSASVEDQQREMDRQSVEIQKHFYKTSTSTDTIEAKEEPPKEKPFTPKQWSKQGKSSISASKTEKEKLNVQTEFPITFQDFIECTDSGPPLKIIYHKPKFNLPIALRADCEDVPLLVKVKSLFQYYAKVEKLRSKLAKESMHRAPYPKPILPSNKCPLVKNSFEGDNGSFNDLIDQMPGKELYVSRAGRQVKRKIYTEEFEGDSDSDFVCSLKKNKADDSDMKITLDNPYIPEENHNETKNTKTIKPKKDTPRPLSLSTKKVGSRSELLIGKVKEDEEKKKQREEEINNFEKTLPSFDESEEFKWSSDSSPIRVTDEQDDSNFVRKRVTPPLPTKRGRSKKTSKLGGANKNATKTTPKKNNENLRRYGNLNVEIEKPPANSTTQKSKKGSIYEEVSSSKVQKTQCPICNKEFLQTEIENHASNCGIDDDDEAVEEVIPATQNTKDTISCALCDKVFLRNTEYEVHVKQCIAAKITNS